MLVVDISIVSTNSSFSRRELVPRRNRNWETIHYQRRLSFRV